MLVAEMSRQECEHLLSRLGYGRLGCARNNQPYVVPVYFAYEPGCLYGFATMGQKIEWMRSNPLVCVQAEEVLNDTEWSSVVVSGHYEEFPDTPEYADRRQRAQSSLAKLRSLWWQKGFAAAQTRQRVDRDATLFFCVRIDEISGRCASPDPIERHR
jgi:nitroimidazol reductase NimA-like FMN-containing flavoprotein (pyridoxamine 5'-phosphate oxidase superfamily)